MDREQHNEHIEAMCATAGMPPALTKACIDPFDYALRLRTGELIYFESASPMDGPWVHIAGVTHVADVSGQRDGGCDFERGLDIRIADIVWVADAPNGS